MSSLLLVPLALGLAAGAGYATHRVALLRERRRYPAPGRLVDVGGDRMHLDVRGAGSPVVVLDAALAGTSLSWHGVQPALAGLTTVASYDRIGFGWSGAARNPRRVDVMAEELHAGLRSAGLSPPFVLVGHSYGGWIATLLASRHREDVAGLVLVDAPHPREWSDPTALQRRRVARGARLARRAASLGEIGLTRLVYRMASSSPGESGRIRELLEKVPDPLRAPLRSFWVKPATLRALASLIENAPESAAIVERTSVDLEDRPLVLLTAAHPSDDRRKDQEGLLRWSRASRHLVSRASGHWIPLEEPELVVTAIRDVVAQVRSKARS